jgi:hypothetical protein
VPGVWLAERSTERRTFDRKSDRCLPWVTDVWLAKLPGPFGPGWSRFVLRTFERFRGPGPGSPGSPGFPGRRGPFRERSKIRRYGVPMRRTERRPGPGSPGVRSGRHGASPGVFERSIRGTSVWVAKLVSR